MSSHGVKPFTVESIFVQKINLFFSFLVQLLEHHGQEDLKMKIRVPFNNILPPTVSS